MKKPEKRKKKAVSADRMEFPTMKLGTKAAKKATYEFATQRVRKTTDTNLWVHKCNVGADEAEARKPSAVEVSDAANREDVTHGRPCPFSGRQDRNLPGNFVYDL